MATRMFISSSTGALDFAWAIQANFRNDQNMHVVVWDQCVFQPGRPLSENLLRQLDKTDVAAFVFAPDDKVTIRGETFTVTRDNVLYELGLFTGRLGYNRVFLATPMNDSQFRLPTDLQGIIAETFDSTRNRSLDERCATLGPFCTRIRDVVKDLSAQMPPVTQCTEVVSELRELLGKHLHTQYVGPFPDFFDTPLCKCIESAQSEILIACDYPNYGAFSLPSVFGQYFKTLEQKAKGDVTLRIIVLDDAGRRKTNEGQFAATDEAWQALYDSGTFKPKLDAFRLSSGRDIRTRTDFVTALCEQQDIALHRLNQITSGKVRELKILMPIYFWISDSRRAVFSIPKLGEGACEYGFETQDRDLIDALKSIWKRYYSETSE